MGHDASELPRDGSIDGLCDPEVGGEEDVKVALVDLVVVSFVDERDGIESGDLTRGVVTGTIRRLYRD